ncbi:MAG: DUF6499 domain-containing protein [Sedimenticola sp.]
MPPDWRNPEDYAYTDHLSDEGWAWEFLKRNPNYQSDYKQISLILNLLEAVHGQLDAPEVDAILRNVSGAYHFDPPRNEGESIDQWIERCKVAGVNPIERRIDYQAGYKWGIDGPIQNPHAEGGGIPKFLSSPSWPRIIEHKEGLDYVDSIYNDPDSPFVLVGFNLNLNIKKQATDATSLLSKEKSKLKSLGKIHRLSNISNIGLLVEHLRLLDADDAGANSSEIGEILFKDDSQDADKVKQRHGKVRDRREAAEKYRDHSYRYLPLRKLK